MAEQLPYNGANDNASGVAGLIGVARAFAAGPRPRRSIVFLVTAGEELGLWGSRYFVDHPAWPIEDIVANINFEMIGRTGRCTATEFVATPSYRHPRFSSLAICPPPAQVARKSSWRDWGPLSLLTSTTCRRLSPLWRHRRGPQPLRPPSTARPL
ncbi:MAG: M20/M25/M40 family metallo-hydrolase [Planctomycetes bacterium]|nr:M20/M25/M40 family metallo-hydrolase [Planctomycetota bacterium]